MTTNPIEAWWLQEMDCCGCGDPEAIINYLKETLELCNLDGWKKNPYEDKERLTAIYWLDSKDYVEHGSSVGLSWLTEKGKALLKMLQENKIEFSDEG